MLMLPQTAIAVLQAGASLRVQSSMLFLETMLAYVAAAKAGGGHLTIVVNGLMLADTMVQVARAGGNHVTFDIYDSQQQ